MGLNIRTTEAIVEKFAQYAKIEGALRFTKPKALGALNPSELRMATLKTDVVQLSKKIAQTPKKLLSQNEIINLKPSEFEDILKNRSDIDSSIKEFVNSPEKMNLYDTIVNLDEINKLPKEQKEKILKEFFKDDFGHARISEANAQAEVMPNLIKKGYDPEFLADLPITNYNKNQVGYVLERKDLVKKLVDSKMEKDIIRTRNRLQNFGQTTEEIEKHLSEYISSETAKLSPRYMKQILRHVDDKNIKYLDECINMTEQPSFLHYWNDETGKILNDFIPTQSATTTRNALDRIFRRGHNYQSVAKIADGKPLTEYTERLLEFKNYDKLKNIDIANFKNLATKEKKELLNGFISAIAPKEALFDMYKIQSGIVELQGKMNIFKSVDAKSKESFMESYYDTIRKMLNEIPENERQLIKTPVSHGDFRIEYRNQNPIPPLVDDLSKTIPTEEVLINGRKIKVATMSKTTNLGIATHRFPGDETILNIEALEITDPNMILCVGLKGGSHNLNFSKSSPSLIVKGRLNNDWYIQARSDMDTGNNATKNLYNIDKLVMRGSGNHVTQSVNYVQELLKKELNLSQLEYTKRIKALKGATTLDEAKKIDTELVQAIKKVQEENPMYEGIVRPEVMAVGISADRPLNEIGTDILDYCKRRNVPLIRVTD